MALQLVSLLFDRLADLGWAGSHYLVFGSVARELLQPQGVDDFGDIDLLTIRPLSLAMTEIKGALNSLGMVCEPDGDACLRVLLDGLNLQLQLVDTEYSKKAFPGGFVSHQDSAFDAQRCVQYPDDGPCAHVPCVPLKHLDTHEKAFYFKGDPKADPLAGRSGREVSAFSLDF